MLIPLLAIVGVLVLIFLISLIFIKFDLEEGTPKASVSILARILKAL